MTNATLKAAAWPLLDETRLRSLMCWAPSHERKFSAVSANHPANGWGNVFPKDRSVSALLDLLQREGGSAAAEVICSRASIRGPAEAVARAARTALASHGRNPRHTPRSRWAYELAALGSVVEAAWLLWLERANSETPPPPPPWAAQNSALQCLIARDQAQTTTIKEDSDPASPSDADTLAPYEGQDPNAAGRVDHDTAEPVASSSEQSEQSQHPDDLVNELRRLLAAPDLDAAVLPQALRDAAERIEIANAAAGLAKERETRHRLAAELDGHMEAIAAVGDAFGGAPVRALASMRSSLADTPLPVARLLVDRARGYAEAALDWKAALDRLPSTHDYAGAAELREAAVVVARALDGPTDVPTESGGKEASSPADGNVPQPTEAVAAAAPVTIATAFTATSRDGRDPATDPDHTHAASLPIGEAADANARSDEEPANVKAFEDAALVGDDVNKALPRVPVTLEPSHAAPLSVEAVEQGGLDAFEPIVDRGMYPEVAYAAPPPATTSLPDLVIEAVRSSLAQGRHGLALHVARAAYAAWGETPFDFEPALLEAVVAGLAVGTPRSERAADAFERERAAVVERLTEGAPLGHQLLAFAAALRPALFAIEAGGNEVIAAADGVVRLGPGLYRLAGLAETARVGELTPADLAEDADGTAPERRLAELQGETERFYDDALRRRIKFQRATRIWLELLKAGPVHDAIRAVIDRSPDAAAAVQLALSGDLADIDRLVTARDRAAIAGRKMQVLTAGARATLTDWLEDLASRLDEWRVLNEAAQRRQLSQHDRRVRDELRTAAEEARTDLASIDPANDPTLEVARTVAQQAVTSLLSLFNGRDSVRLSLEMRRDDDLLLLPSPWDRNRAEWTKEDAERLAREIAALQVGDRDFSSAFEREIRRGRFGQAIQARERLVLADPSLREALDVRLAGERDGQMEVERRRLGQVRKRLNDLLGADDRQVLNRDLGPELDKLSAMLRGVGDPQIDLADWRRRLALIDVELDVAFRTLLGPLQERVDRLAQNGVQVDDLRKMVELKDLTTLSEHVDAYEKGGTSPSSPTELLEAFSAEMLSGLAEHRHDLASLQQAIAVKGRIGSVDYAAFEEGQLEAAGDLLAAWRALRGFQGKDASTALSGLFVQLLKSSVSVKPGRGATAPYELRTPTFASRDECVAPAFGSAAEGRYDVVLVDSRSIANGAELANLKAQCSASTFFVVRGLMDPAARQAFMVQVRSKGPNPACGLIDEALVLFLATRAARQRSDLFSLALAMGVVQPYSNAAQQTSPEMFFGRVEELRELWDPNGSCLVYGGRQLGKTALLRQIELRHDKPDQIVIYGDQDLEGFGDGRSTTFWRWIARRTQARGVPFGSTIGRQTSEAIREEICAWLAEDGARRLVFLIDEADAFLRREIRTGFQGNSILVEVRELMRVTNRRCKFVFAGLHDVQRLARTPNSPLLHFGVPIRVGPLMGKDLFEARGMVEVPMATVGYAFGRTSEEGRALVGRALSEVGYYPSLMQTFGTVLINRLNGQAATRIGNPPGLPIRITEAELDEALDDDLFRENVRLNFDKTLNLDPRYRLIAYVVLLGTQESADREDVRPGMSVAEIQRDALFWWPQGFTEDPTNSAFEGLLKEMEGLGVLVGLRGGRYAIRSARIAAMLGTLREVEDRVEELAAEPFIPTEDTGGSRRLLGTAPSPLTFRQEGVLLERRGAAPVAMALTSTALGRAEISEALRGIAEERLFMFDHRVTNVRELERTISLVASRMKQGQCGLLVATGSWLGSDAVAAALAHPEVRRAQRNSNLGVRVLLLPSGIDWQELEGIEPGDPLWGATPVTLSTLQRGGLREWLARRTDNNAPPVGVIERLRDATGGFPTLLSRLDGRTVDSLVSAAEAAAELMLTDPVSALPFFGLDDGWLRTIASFVNEQVGDTGFDRAAREILVALLEEDGVRAPERGLEVLGILGVLDHVAEDQPTWRLNPLIARLLRAAS